MPEVSESQAPKQRVLFLCTGNACRSQMAEGWARALRSGSIQASSAGIERHGLNPSAVQVMFEAGVDISTHRSKTLDDLSEAAFDQLGLQAEGRIDVLIEVLPAPP